LQNKKEKVIKMTGKNLMLQICDKFHVSHPEIVEVSHVVEFLDNEDLKALTKIFQEDNSKKLFDFLSKKGKEKKYIDAEKKEWANLEKNINK